jgi:predicted transcriptional regulator
MPNPRKRNQDIRVRVTAEVMERTKRVADLLGMPPSTLASLALAQFIAQQERGLVMVDRMADAIGGQMGQEFKTQLEAQLGAGPAQQKLFQGPGRRKKTKRGEL